MRVTYPLGPVLFAAMAVALLAAPASAQYVFSASEHETSVAGQTGDDWSRLDQNTTQVGNSGPAVELGMKGIVVAENRDTPCFFRIEVSDANVDDRFLSPSRVACSNPRGDIETSLGRDTYIYKLQVCTNDRANATRRHFVKGLRIWGRAIGDGQLSNVGAAVTDEQPNCRNNWGDNGVATCPAGQVATAVKTHYRDHEPTGIAVVGFSLICGEVLWPTTEDDADAASGSGATRPGRTTDLSGRGGKPGAQGTGGGLGAQAGKGEGSLSTGGNAGGAARPDSGGQSANRPTGIRRPGTPEIRIPRGGNSSEPDVPLTLGWSETTTHGPSGRSAIYGFTHLADSDRALTSLIFRERSDAPNHIEFVGKRLCANEECPSATETTLQFANEDGNVTSQRSVWVGERNYAVGLQVCNSSSGRIKGTRLWGASINADGSLQRQGDEVQFSRTNCGGNWQEVLWCPENAVIVGLTAHYDSAGVGFTALSIRCGRVSLGP